MLQVITCTALIMAGAFIIGIAVAYIIKFITVILGGIDNFSINKEIQKRKRYSKIHKIRKNIVDKSSYNFQKQLHNPMLDYYYYYSSDNEKDVNKKSLSNNDIIRYYYGNN